MVDEGYFTQGAEDVLELNGTLLSKGQAEDSDGIDESAILLQYFGTSNKDLTSISLNE